MIILNLDHSQPMDVELKSDSEESRFTRSVNNDDHPDDQQEPEICDNKEKYKCQLCEKIFSRMSNMKRHVMTHTGERPHNCPHCEMKFSLKTTLQRHLRLHTGEKPYTCETCHKTFRQRSNYSIHRKLHTGEKNYVCEVCGRQFVQKNHFELHILSHSGEKAFACQHCSKRFSHNSYLKQHSIIHKEDTERKSFVCHICDKKFCTNRSLDYHLKAHAGIKNFQCKSCGTCFQQRNALNRHLRQNEFSDFGKCQYKDRLRERFLECNFCLKKFSTKVLLRNHIYTHIGEKPYECKYCDKKFTVKSSLNFHVKMKCKGKQIGQEADSNLCNNHLDASAIEASKGALKSSQDAFDTSSSHGESFAAETLIETSLKLDPRVEASKEDIHGPSIPSKSFISLANKTILSTNTYSSSDEPTHIGGIDKMTKHLSISQELGSECVLKDPSKQLSTLAEERGVISGVVNIVTNRGSAKSDCLEAGTVIFSDNMIDNYSLSESTECEDFDIKEEIDIVHEDIE